MTTVMLIAAMVPIALGRGPGAASRPSLAKVVLGGQTLSLLLTLLLTPVAYSLWDDLSQFWSRLWARFRPLAADNEEAEEESTLPAVHREPLEEDQEEEPISGEAA